MHTPFKSLSIALVLCIAFCVNIVPAQNTKAASPLTSLVNSERDFALASAERGMDSAFMAFLADDAVIFRPHPVNGQEWFRSHPTSTTVLTWSPGFAEVSVTGELGYTTGPWTARDKVDATSPPAYGEFVTIWKKKGNAWKVELDMGISHPAPATGVHFTPSSDDSGPSVLVRPDSGFLVAQWSSLRAREQAAFGDSLHYVPVSNFVPMINPEVRVFRPGHFPVVGSDSVVKFLDSQPGKIFRRSLGGSVSRGGDLGYTYGSYHFQGKDETNKMEGYYLTVWKKEGKGEWSIVLDVESTLPKKQQ